VPQPWEWEEDDLELLIRTGVQESIELDYKSSADLRKTDGKKGEISRDVSAFGNSAGGVLVYGVKEDKHVPIEIDDGCDPNEITKEWLEQVINSTIQHRIEGVRVKQVALVNRHPGRVAYIVYVPQSLRAPHQASDKRF
jgi:predicted HTH transcriptional regulator